MGRVLSTLIGAAVIAFLWLPLAAVAIQSVNQNRRSTLWAGFTLKWYEAIPRRRDVLDALWNTALVAGISTAIATVLGTLLAIGLARLPAGRRLRGLTEGTLHLPVIVPDLILALALVVAFMGLEWATGANLLGLGAIIVGHVTLQVAFVALVVRSRLALIGPEQEEAARDLYASTAGYLRRVLLPQLVPAIIGGAVLAFTLSLDDFIIALFAKTPQSTTLPILVWGEFRRGISPELNAIQTLVVLATAVLALILTRLGHAQTAHGAPR